MSNKETDICYLPATQLVELFEGKTLSPVDVTKAVLERIEAVDGDVNAFSLVNADEKFNVIAKILGKMPEVHTATYFTDAAALTRRCRHRDRGDRRRRQRLDRPGWGLDAKRLRRYGQNPGENARSAQRSP